MSRLQIILTTTGSEQQALTIAEELIQQKLAACVNILPTMRSLFRFKGKILDDEENLLIIKTTSNKYEGVAHVIRQLHTYEVPEIIGFNVDESTANVRDWIMGAVGDKT